VKYAFRTDFVLLGKTRDFKDKIYKGEFTVSFVHFKFDVGFIVL